MKNLTLVFVLFIATILPSCANIDPGEEGVFYYPYSSGLDTSETYTEGTYGCWPWNDVYRYSILQQTRGYQQSLMDKNGTEIVILASVNFSLKKGRSGAMHLKYGEDYAESFVDVKSKGAIKDVIGRYTYEEVYSTKREALESEIEELLVEDFNKNYLTLHFVEIADVNLPKDIATEIINKETQKQRNLTSKEKQIEMKNLADAKIEEARGDSAKLIINAMSEAKAIDIKQTQLRKSPLYIEYMKAEKWDGSYGTGNVFGSGITLFKNVR